MEALFSYYWIYMAATAAFAASAVLAVSESDIDIFGAFVFGIVTAIGGGTMRDLILDVPVFWAEQQSSLY